MILVTKGNLIQADAEALVNTVNCQGFMGKGIALQFKRAFPANFKVYEKACRAGQVQPGRMLVVPTGTFSNPKYVINFPTKRKWREKSRIEDIESGLQALVEELRARGITSVAVPPLGSGLGGLDWRDVRPRIERALGGVPDVRVLLFEPGGAPPAKEMPVRTQRPTLTPSRALLIRLIHEYDRQAYRLTLLEIQKLAYFLQEAGEPLRLAYVAHRYGPFAHNLNKALESMEGHYITGYGDQQKPDVEIELRQGVVPEADRLLAGRPDSAARLARVADVIEGFETPYGMELLSSVHWVAVHGEPRAASEEEAVRAVHSWNDRKRTMFREEHIHVAWDRLQEMRWLTRETGV